MAPLITPIHVILGLPSKNKELVTYCKIIHTSLSNNPHFPTPTPSLTVFGTDVADLDTAEASATSRTPGAASVRNAKKAKVVQDLHHLRDYVQGVVELLTTDALPVAESSGFGVKKQRSYNKQVLAVQDGATSGSVHLVAKAVARVATYYWQYSLDGKTWTSCPETLKANTTIVGLTPGQSYSFRFRSLTSAGASDFSQIVTHMVK